MPQNPVPNQRNGHCGIGVRTDIARILSTRRRCEPDELKYRIKGGKYGPNGRSLTEDFDTALNIFIQENNLDGDPHALASLPKTEKQ